MEFSCSALFVIVSRQARQNVSWNSCVTVWQNLVMLRVKKKITTSKRGY